MTQHPPQIADGILQLRDHADADQIPVDSPRWQAWLADPSTRSFAFSDVQGHFTARKERRQRGGEYWIAYRKVDPSCATPIWA